MFAISTKKLAIAVAASLSLVAAAGSQAAAQIVRTGPSGRQVTVDREVDGDGVNTVWTAPGGREAGYRTTYEDGKLIRTWQNGKTVEVERTYDDGAVRTIRTGPNGRETGYTTRGDGNGRRIRTFDNGYQTTIDREFDNGTLSTTRTGPNGRSFQVDNTIEDGQLVRTGPRGNRWTLRRLRR
ncbi:MAG: hypothetical protein AAFX40_00615 [Cyanobacteria bacterium J06639_1]